MGPEDYMRADIGRLILGKPFLHAAQWEALVQTLLKPDGSVPSSNNWLKCSEGLSCAAKFPPGIGTLQRDYTYTNKYMHGEFQVDPQHASIGYNGLVVISKHCPPGMLPMAVDDRVQFMAQLMLAANQLSSPRQTRFGFAHQRTIAPVGTIDTHLEYYYRRGCGIKHDDVGPVCKNQAERIYTNQDPFTAKLFTDKYLADIAADVTKLRAAYASEGWSGIGKYIKRGGVCTYHWIRLKNGRYWTVQENDNGIDEARLVVGNGSGTTVNYPPGIIPRREFPGSASVQVSGNTVTISATFTTTQFKTTFLLSDVEYWLVSSPAGVSVRVGGTGRAEIPASEVPESEPEPEAPVDTKRSWWPWTEI